MLSEQASNVFHQQLTQIVDDMRETFNEMDLSRIYIQITVSGRPTSDLLMEYKVGADSYGSDAYVVGNKLRTTLEEFMRRKGWIDTHNPLSLTYTSNKENEDV